MLGKKTFSAAEKRFRNREHGPVLVSVRPTPACNARCVMCSNWKLPRKPIRFDALERAVKEAVELGAIELRISGGEPLLYPGLEKLVLLASDSGLDVSVNTTGYPLDGKKAENLAKAGLGGIFLSLDSPKPEIHDRMRGLPGCWNRAVSASQNASENGITVVTNTLITRETYRDVPELIRMSDGARFDEISPMYIIACPDLFLKRDQILEYNKSIVPEIEKAAAESSVKIRTGDAYIFGRTESELRSSERGDYSEDRIPAPCLATLFTAYITEEGKVFPCTESAYGNDLFLGNVLETRFSEILAGQGFGASQKKAGTCGSCKHCKYEYIVFNRWLRSEG